MPRSPREAAHAAAAPQPAARWPSGEEYAPCRPRLRCSAYAMTAVTMMRRTVGQPRTDALLHRDGRGFIRRSLGFEAGRLFPRCRGPAGTGGRWQRGAPGGGGGGWPSDGVCRCGTGLRPRSTAPWRVVPARARRSDRRRVSPSRSAAARGARRVDRCGRPPAKRAHAGGRDEGEDGDRGVASAPAIARARRAAPDRWWRRRRARCRRSAA